MEAINTTKITITIDEENKDDLLKIGAKLQMELKKELNFNIIIKHLISFYNKQKDITKLRSACKPVKDVNLDDVLNELYEERKRDESRFTVK